MNTKHRLVIFCIYNKFGKITIDVEYLLQQLTTISSEIIIVINGDMYENEVSKIRKYSSTIIKRENVGYDYGAYQYVLLEKLKPQIIKQYDSLILCNDTFYGFFEPIEKIVCEMDTRAFDVWGLNALERGLLNHICSYFLVFNRSKGLFDDLISYFQNNKIANESYGEAAAFMEPKMYRYFKNKKYRIGYYTDVSNNNVTACPYKCIVEKHLPILKKKSLNLSIVEEKEIVEVINYIRRNSLYPNELITQFSIVDQKIAVTPQQFVAKIMEQELLDFSEQDFYIFGAGLLAQELYHTYFEENIHFKGFIVTAKKNGEDAYELKDVPNGIRVIIGVNYNLTKEVKSMLPSNSEVLELWRK